MSHFTLASVLSMSRHHMESLPELVTLARTGDLDAFGRIVRRVA